MNTAIIVKLEVEGIHSWPEAKNFFPEVAYLSDPHRHVFYIYAVKHVTHADRDIEIIMFKRKLREYIDSKYWDVDFDLANFGRMSCEQIATELVTEFQLHSCQVLEDDENGAIVWI